MNLNFEEEKKKERRRQIIKEIIRWLIEITIVVVLAYLLIHFCMLRTEMAGGSMEDTLRNGQEVIVNKAAYVILSPSRNDIIAFQQTEEEEELEGDYLVTFRRIIGLPGERVQIKEGNVYINGEILKEKHKMPKMESGGMAYSEVTLGEDEYFVLGDSRNNSEDSRFRSFGNIKRKNILGKAIFKMEPFALIGGPSAEEETEE